MIIFTKLLKGEFGKIAMSIILGLGLASVFRKVCKNRNCLVFHSPSEDLEKNTYLHDDKCYTLQSKTVSCDEKKKNVEFA